jgi:hypothetical protein
MAAPAQVNALLAADFPKGLADRASTDKLFQILNPFLRQVGSVTTQGTSLGQNVDGQLVSLQIQTPATDWIPLAPTGTWANFGAGNGPNLSYRKDAIGTVWVQGLLKTGPGAYPSTIATLPDGYRPAGFPARVVTMGQIPAGPTDGFGHLDVTTAGNIDLNYFTVAGALTYLITNINFPSADLSPGILPCFPVNVRLKDGKRPSFVVAQASAKAGELVSVLPSYTVLGTGSTGNLLRLDNLPGLALDTTYQVQLFIFF